MVAEACDVARQRVGGSQAGSYATGILVGRQSGDSE